MRSLLPSPTHRPKLYAALLATGYGLLGLGAAFLLLSAVSVAITMATLGSASVAAVGIALALLFTPPTTALSLPILAIGLSIGAAYGLLSAEVTQEKERVKHEASQATVAKTPPSGQTQSHDISKGTILKLTSKATTEETQERTSTLAEEDEPVIAVEDASEKEAPTKKNI